MLCRAEEEPKQAEAKPKQVEAKSKEVEVKVSRLRAFATFISRLKRKYKLVVSL